MMEAKNMQEAFEYIYGTSAMGNRRLIAEYREEVENAEQGDSTAKANLPFFENVIMDRMKP